MAGAGVARARGPGQDAEAMTAGRGKRAVRPVQRSNQSVGTDPALTSRPTPAKGAGTAGLAGVAAANAPSDDAARLELGHDNGRSAGGKWFAAGRLYPAG